MINKDTTPEYSDVLEVMADVCVLTDCCECNLAMAKRRKITECTIFVCVHHDAAKYGCDHLDAVIRTWTHLKNDVSLFVCPGFSLITPLKTLQSVMLCQGSRSHGLRAQIPCCCKRHQTVYADTCCLTNDPNS
ncbi:hypothetical protein TNCV_1658641 [Trichonephila clavipes]|nr:hypothetical protein TNCV_1658641 [Trichonephila clavipes]